MRKIAWFCIIIFVTFLWLGCATQMRTRPRRIPKTYQAKKTQKNIAIFKVAKLDKNAVTKITASMKKLNAVQSVKVDVKKGIVTVILKKNKTVPVNRLRQAIKRAGYRPKQTLQSPLELGQLEKQKSKFE